MTRQRLELHDGDLALLARVLGIDEADLRDELARTPWSANDVLRRPEVVDAILHGDDADQLTVSPMLFFAVLVHRAADELAATEWVDEWVGPGQRLPVFDVEPLLEFSDAPGRLLFTTQLLVEFAVPGPSAVPVQSFELDELVDWLDAVDPGDRVRLLRQLGDIALFRAGVFPDHEGATAMPASQAEHLGRSVPLTDEELDHLVDHGSPTPGLDALETLSAAWYRAAAEGSPSSPVVLRDIAHRIRAARRFLNYVADHYLHQIRPAWTPG